MERNDGYRSAWMVGEAMRESDELRALEVERRSLSFIVVTEKYKQVASCLNKDVNKSSNDGIVMGKDADERSEGKSGSEEYSCNRLTEEYKLCHRSRSGQLGQ